MLILRSAITVITAVLLFVACAAPAIRAQQTTEQNSAGAPLADRLNSWIGRSLEDFIRMTGPPSRDFRLADGGRAIEYDDSYDVIVPVPISHRVIVAPRDGGPNIFAATPVDPGAYGLVDVTPPSSQTALSFNAGTEYVPQRVLRTCLRDFFADPQGILVRWTQRGDGCDR
jgi:hypothetical protein